MNSRQAETVERLLAAGAEELRAVGSDSLTIRTVAGRAGVEPGDGVHHFASKNHLFAELFWRALLTDPPARSGRRRRRRAGLRRDPPPHRHARGRT